MIYINHYIRAELIWRMPRVRRDYLDIPVPHGKTYLNYGRINILWRKYFYHFSTCRHEPAVNEHRAVWSHHHIHIPINCYLFLSG